MTFTLAYEPPASFSISRVTSEPSSGLTDEPAGRGQGCPSAHHRAGGRQPLAVATLLLARWEVAAQAGAGDAGLGHDLGHGVTRVAQVGGVAELGRLDHARPSYSTALGRRHRPGVRGSLEGVGPFHLGKKRQQ